MGLPTGLRNISRSHGATSSTAWVDIEVAASRPNAHGSICPSLAASRPAFSNQIMVFGDRHPA